MPECERRGTQANSLRSKALSFPAEHLRSGVAIPCLALLPGRTSNAARVENVVCGGSFWGGGANDPVRAGGKQVGVG